MRIAKLDAAGLGSGQSSPGALRDLGALLLGDRGVDVQHERVGVGDLGDDERHALRHQGPDERDIAAQAIELGDVIVQRTGEGRIRAMAEGIQFGRKPKLTGLSAGVLEDGKVYPSEEGTPQGGSISVLLSNLYLHYVLDLWFERVVKSRLRSEARLVRYIDDFVICFQYRSDAIRVRDALRLRLGKFGLTLEPTKTKLVEFGRFAQRHAGKRG